MVTNTVSINDRLGDGGLENVLTSTTNSDGSINLIAQGQEVFLSGQLLSVTTLTADTADLAALATNGIIPFPTAVRDDLSLRDPVNLGRIWIPAAAQAIRIVAPIAFNALAAGTYRRINFNIVINGVATSTITTPNLYQLGIKPVTAPIISGQTTALCFVSAMIDTSAWNAPAALGDSYIELKVQHDTAGADVVTQAGSAFSLEVYS